MSNLHLLAAKQAVRSIDIREFKHDVYGRRQMAKMTSDFLFFSSDP